METDNQLLGSYAKSGSERAFRELVERRINLVHSAALRESGGDGSFAQDITQAVFTELARNANSLARHPALSGWLYTCVRRMSASVRRAEHRRQRREQEAFTMDQLLSSDPADNLWQQSRPLLDDVMHELSEEDRTAVVLRFFEGRSLKEVGLALGSTENAARMRVERSLERIRSSLSKRGVNSTAATLAAVLATGAVITAPSTLASTVATGALTAAASSSITTFTVARLLTLAKSKPAVIRAMVVIAAAIFTWNQFRSNQAASQQTTREQGSASSLASGTNAPATQESSNTRVAARTNAPDSPQMALQIIDADTREPLPDTKLFMFYMFDDGRGERARATTDLSGKFGVEMLQLPFHGLNLFVTADGHVPKVTSWGFGRAMPAEYRMKLERGIRVGGVVLDQGGQPIAGVRIKFEGPGNDMTQQENIQFGPDTVTVTDAAGRWSCNMIPRELQEITLLLTHSEHAETKATINPQAPEATNSIITMVAGFSIAGMVQDLNGNTVAGATVREVRLNSEGERSQKTDASGSFEFKNMKEGQLMLSVQAPGFAPAFQSLQITGNLSSIRFPLGAGQLLRGHLVDEAGNSVTNAFAETTRVDIDKTKWSTNTDAQGKFEWDSAPQEPLAYSFLAEGFNRVYALKLQADGSEHEIKLTRSRAGRDTIQIFGTVHDADTGQPVDGFRVLLGKVDPDWAAPFRFTTTGSEGQFTMSQSADSLQTNYLLEIEKEGYLPTISENLSVNDGNPALVFQLRKGSGPCGIVLLPDGEPASDAAVFLCVPQSGVTINGPARVDQGNINTTTYHTRTDNDGKFSLPAAVDPQAIIVVHDQGYAKVSLTEFGSGGTLTLQPWGRIDGSVMLDSQPAPNERVVAYGDVYRYDEQGHRVTVMRLTLETKTDSAGNFSFEKMPPGEFTVYRQKILGGQFLAGFESHEASVVVKAGGVTQVVLGGSGRAVIGTALIVGATGSIDWQNVPVRLRSKLANEPGPYPRRHNFSSNEAFIAAMEKWDQARRAKRAFGTFCNSNGSFRLQDIPAGTYELQIKLLDSKLDSVSPRQRYDPAPEIGSIVREVIVPEISMGQTAEPVDLGTLELLPRQDRAAAN
jgi:RNA polymerase sigma factor (sigma-70 family)